MIDRCDRDDARYVGVVITPSYCEIEGSDLTQ
jgi:hypothetical protein